MILVDANGLLYAYDASSAQHTRARAWWETTLSGAEPVLLPWPTLLAFLRIGTHASVFADPLTISEGTACVSAWLERPCVRLLSPEPDHWSSLERLLNSTNATGNLAMDAALAALAIETGALLCSTDSDFSRFPGLRWKNPLP